MGEKENEIKGFALAEGVSDRREAEKKPVKVGGEYGV